MAKFDHGGGCPCGLYRTCEPECEHYRRDDLSKAKIFDFGFTAVDETEVSAVKDAKDLTLEYSERLEKLYDSILPLLDNLSKNPDSEYIHWPNRADKISAFKEKLRKIKEGVE